MSGVYPEARVQIDCSAYLRIGVLPEDGFSITPATAKERSELGGRMAMLSAVPCPLKGARGRISGIGRPPGRHCP